MLKIGYRLILVIHGGPDSVVSASVSGCAVQLLRNKKSPLICKFLRNISPSSTKFYLQNVAISVDNIE